MGKDEFHEDLKGELENLKRLNNEMSLLDTYSQCCK